jgi:hypothetical protein
MFQTKTIKNILSIKNQDKRLKKHKNIVNKC